MSRELSTWIAQLFSDTSLSGMGHAQRVEDLNLGLGWMYYGLARVVRPQRIVVIGSWRGFAPMVFARALQDNGEGGRVTFIDPSLVDDFWQDTARVNAHFGSYGLDNIDHYCMTTQQYVQTAAYRATGELGLVMVDGFHSDEQARFDHAAFAPLLAANGYVLFHDSVRERLSRIYDADNPYLHTVKRYMDDLRRDPAWEVLELPFGDGLCIVRHRSDAV